MIGKKILLVEGSDDEHVFKHICGERGVGHLDAVEQQKSVNELLENFPVWLKYSNIEALGVVLDADENFNGRWDALRNRLKQAGYTAIPDRPMVAGTVIAPPENTLLPRFGAWLMPDNQSNGILEDFLRFLVPPGSTLLKHVESSVNAISTDDRRFSSVSKPKVIIHTWLAWQEEPGLPFGTAIKARFLDPSLPQGDAVANWLRRLYFPSN